MGIVRVALSAEDGAGRRLTVALVAGEASGDLLGSQLLLALQKLAPGIDFVGIGGPRMASAGMDVWFPMEKLAVRGYVEVLRQFPEILAIRRKLRRRLLAQPPALFIGIDAPDFNLSLERDLRANRVPTVHYVSPSIWMWRGRRMNLIRRAVSKMLTVFPFEAPLYQKAGVDVEYVGHPLADMLGQAPNRAEAREILKLRAHEPVIALLPGSRQSELRHMADLFVRTARAIHERSPRATFVVPLQSRETRDLFETALYAGDGAGLPLTMLFGHAHEALAAADVALVASGTATLEAMLLRCPLVITYRMPDLSYRILRAKKKYLPYYGLPNILAGEFVTPEILQHDATPQNLCQAVLNLLQDEVVRGRLERKFGAIGATLEQGAARRAALAILPMLGLRRDAA